MTAPFDETKSLFTSIRVTLAISGAVALIAGVVLLVWPLKSAVIVTGIFASYLILAGLVYLGLGIFSGQKGGWARAGHILLGILYIAAGAVAFLYLPAATITLALITVILIGISWIVDGIVALTLLHGDGSRVWTILYAILSILAGAIVLFSPFLAAIALWWVLGVGLVVLGVVQIVRAITLGRDEKKKLAAAVHDDAATSGSTP